jgi:hypothetical protein
MRFEVWGVRKNLSCGQALFRLGLRPVLPYGLSWSLSLRDVLRLQDKRPEGARLQDKREAQDLYDLFGQYLDSIASFSN